MEATLVVIGLSHRTAPVEVRERFWMNEARRHEALAFLARAEGIDEVLVISTCKRTEFLVWGDPTLAENSVVRLLSANYDLKLCDWRNFYRLLDEQAIAHAFRVSCGLDSLGLGEGQIARQVNAAWQQARACGGTGPFLDLVLRKALCVRRRVRKETAISTSFLSIPYAAVELAARNSGRLSESNVLIFGAGTMGATAAQALVSRGVQSLCIASRSMGRARSLANRYGVQACTLEEGRTRLSAADLAIAASATPQTLLSVGEISQSLAQRGGRPLVIMDLGMPRNVDPAAGSLNGVELYDLDDLTRASRTAIGSTDAELEAERIVLAEAQEFGKALRAADAMPAMEALRRRLDEICRQELESFRLEQGPFPKEQDQLLAAVSARITHKIAGSLARELRGLGDAERTAMKAWV